MKYYEPTKFSFLSNSATISTIFQTATKKNNIHLIFVVLKNIIKYKSAILYKTIYICKRAISRSFKASVRVIQLQPMSKPRKSGIDILGDISWGSHLQEEKRQPPKLRLMHYLAAVLSVVVTLILIRTMANTLGVTAPVSLLLCAIIFSAWYGGVRPGLLALVLALIAFKFYFVDTVYSWNIDPKELPRFLVFALSSLFVVLLIGAQRTATGSLRLAYQRLSYHVENTPLAVIELDKDLTITRWSGRAEEIFGWKASEALGKNVNHPDFPLIYEEDKKAVDQINEELTKGTVNRNLSLNRNYTKFGQVIDCEWHNSVLRDEQGNPITILSLVHDVTERKMAEQNLNHSYEEVRQLTNHLQNIREEERSYIAREIHDELGQQLTVLKMDVLGLSKKLGDSDAVHPGKDPGHYRSAGYDGSIGEKDLFRIAAEPAL